MPRGKKTTPEVVYKIMASWAVTQNYSETARSLDIPMKTVEKIVKENKDKPEFAKVCDEKKKDFAAKATETIDLAFKRLTEVLSDETNYIPVNHLTTVIGTMFDKKALIEGKPTENAIIKIKLPNECEDYAK